jgi:fructose-1,6-bisphosphatase/inositol monophosphatase family enzyme
MKNFLISALKVSGKTILEYFNSPIETQQKESQSSIVTEADIESEKIITTFKKKGFPAHNIISEEGGFTNNKSVL